MAWTLCECTRDQDGCEQYPAADCPQCDGRGVYRPTDADDLDCSERWRRRLRDIVEPPPPEEVWL